MLRREKTLSSINHSILSGYLNSQPVSALLCSTKLCVLQIKPNYIHLPFFFHSKLIALTATIYDSDKDDQKDCSLFHSAEESRERGRERG